MRRGDFPVAGDRGGESSAPTGYWRREEGRKGGNGVMEGEENRLLHECRAFVRRGKDSGRHTTAHARNE